MVGLTPQTRILQLALGMMVADPQSPLDADERQQLLDRLYRVDTFSAREKRDLVTRLLPWIQQRAPRIGHIVQAQLRESYDSPLEELFAYEWNAQALDLVYPLSAQYPVKEGHYHLDFAFPPLQCGIELDGYAYHSDRETFTQDRARQREIEALGWRVIRFSGDELRDDIAACVREAARMFDRIKRLRNEDC